jgi:hypothetical protein
VLLARRDSAFDLVVWLAVPSFDVKAGRDLAVTPRELAVVPGRAAAWAEVYRPGQSPRPTSRLDAPRTIRLQVPDEPLVIRLKPARGSARLSRVQPTRCLASIRFPGRRSLFFPDASAGRYSFAAGAGRPFLACSTR